MDSFIGAFTQHIHALISVIDLLVTFLKTDLVDIDNFTNVWKDKVPTKYRISNIIWIQFPNFTI